MSGNSNAWVLVALEAHCVTPAPIFPAKMTGIHGASGFVWNFRYGDRAVSCCTAYANLTNRDVQSMLDLAGIRIDIPSGELEGTEHPLLMKRTVDDSAVLLRLVDDSEPILSPHRDTREHA